MERTCRCSRREGLWMGMELGEDRSRPWQWR